MSDRAALHPNGQIGVTLRAIAHEILSKSRDTLKAGADDPVHDFRKSMKRWRAYVRLLEPLIGKNCRKLRIEARDLARKLAGARDAEAAREAFKDATGRDARLAPKPFDSIRKELNRLSAAAKGAGLTTETIEELNRWLDQALAAVDQWRLDKIHFADLTRELSATYRRARAAMPDDWANAAPNALHSFRQRVVEHRYQMELVEPLWPKLNRLWIDQAQKLRDHLGQYQDLVILLRLTEPRQPLEKWRIRMEPLIALRQAEHLVVAQRLAGRLFAERPKALRRRLDAIWESESRNGEPLG